MLATSPKRLFLRYRKKGDATALGKLFDQIAPELLTLATHLTRDVSIAEDVVQDTFLSAVESADRYDADRPFMPWLVGILVNRARKARERRAIQAAREANGPPGGLGELVADDRRPAPTLDPAQTAAAHEVVGIVGEAIETLREPYREVVREHLSDGQPPREIARKLKRSAGTVRVQLHRGLEQLRTALGADGEHSRAIERLSSVGIGLPASAKLSAGATRGLDAVRDALLRELGQGTAGVATEAAVASNAALALKGGLVAAGLAAAATVTMTLPNADVVERMPQPEPTAVELEDADLAEVTARLAPVSDQRLAAPKPQARSAGHGIPSRVATKRAPKKDAAKDAKPAINAAPEQTFEFVIRYRHQARNIEDANPYQSVRLIATGPNLLPLGEGKALLDSPTNVSIGSYASVSDLPRDIFIRSDHEDLLPLLTTVRSGNFAFDGERFVLDSSVRLGPIGPRIRVHGAPAADPGERVTRSDAFEGRAVFVTIDPRGRPLILDDQTLRKTARSNSVQLRAQSFSGTDYVLGIPRRADYGGDLIKLIPPRGDDLELGARLRRRQLPTLKIRVIDPFGDPVVGAKLIALVPEPLVTHFERQTDAPTQIEGWVFVDTSRQSDISGQLNSSGSPTAHHEGIVRARIEAESLSTGTIRLNGAIDGIHQLWMQTSVSDSPVPMNVSGLFGQQWSQDVLAPIAGINIVCPPELRNAGGADAWANATVTVTGGDKAITGAIDRVAGCQMLVQADRVLKVTMTPPGWPTFKATLEPMTAGTKRRVMPRLPKGVKVPTQAGETKGR